MSTTTATPAPAGTAPDRAAHATPAPVDQPQRDPGRGPGADRAGRSSSSIFAILSDNYLTTGNLTTITKQVAFNAIVALGHAAGHPERRHRPLGRLDRRA